MENHAVGTIVGITVMATDPETEHSISYFTDTRDAHSSFFSVGRTSGIVTLAQPVDYDPPSMHRQFSFRVMWGAIFNSQSGGSSFYISLSLSLSLSLSHVPLGSGH